MGTERISIPLGYKLGFKIHMRKLGHNALNRTLYGVPSNYFSNSNGFGTPTADTAVLSAWGNLHAEQITLVQHQLVRRWLSGGRKPTSIRLGVMFGFSRSSWSGAVTA
jgi:hypothetical protein